MKGISFSLPNQYDCYINKIFSGISITNYYWDICQYEILFPNNMGHISDSFFDGHLLCGNDFKNAISRESYYIVNANIKAFKTKSEIKPIATYNDFLSSSCDIILICTDTTFVELYSKSEPVLKQVSDNCRKYAFPDLIVITNRNDNRTRLDLS